MKTLLFAGLAILAFIFLFGCIQTGIINEQDRFNSKTTINVAQKTNLEPASNSTTPCTCMICSQEEPSIFDEIWYALGIQDKLIENDLQGANCFFEACNSSIYTSLLSEFDPGKGVWAECPEDAASSSSSGNSQNKYDDKVCAPRYFMLGQGASSAEFSLAQRYCSGRLNMPIIWAYSKDASKPPKAPSPQTMMCHLSKSQMPLVIWYSEGKHINDEAYKKMVDSYDDATTDPPVKGPIMLSTEALLEPYKTKTDGTKYLDIQLLEKVRSQIDYTALNCPSCIPVLALKQTFTSDGLPDLCPIDYFLKYNTSLPDMGDDPLNCSSKYENPSQYSSRPATRENYLQKIGAIGIAFIANENANLTTCTPMYDIARHLRYSDELLLHYHSPSVWYAVGISPGATNTPNCAFSKAEVADAYSFLMAGIPGFVASGVIGVSPYTFLSSSSAPLPCKSQLFYGSLDYAAFSTIEANKKFTTLQGAQINTTKVFFKNESYVSFEDEFSNSYIAYYDDSTLAFLLNLTGCNFGFRLSDGSMQNLSSFSWFSACQLYFTNNAPLFEADLTSVSQIRAGTKIKPKIDGLPSLQVLSVNSSEDGHVIFFSGDKRYSAKKDGKRIMIYDMARLNYSQQPLMFSANSVGSTCAPFESGKMLYYTALSRPAEYGQYGIEPPQSPDELKKIAALQCGGCLSSVKMPFNFCNIEGMGTISFPEDACTQYPEMDVSFISRNIDPILMRAISVGEGSRLGRQSSDPSPDAPACTISPTSRADWCGGKAEKQPSNLAKFESPYCIEIEQKAQNIVTAYGGICALGLMQCIKPPSDSYNPFNPVDSADCGSYEFKEKPGRYDDYLSNLQSLRSSNPSIDAFNPKKGGIRANEIEWYAAWIAAYRYSGMGKVDTLLIKNYVQQDSSDNIVKYVHRELVDYCADLRDKNPDADCYPFYGTKTILLYNEAISVCSNGCPHQICEALAEGDDGYEDESYLD